MRMFRMDSILLKTQLTTKQFFKRLSLKDKSWLYIKVNKKQLQN
jgi:hypothetical protein